MNTKPGTNPLKVILIAGLVAGTLDIIAALTQFYINTGKDPQTVLKYIASAVFGKKAYSGGIAMSIVGLIFHYIIAISLAAFFVLLYQRWKLLSRNIVVTGLLYGIFAWLVTTQILIPLTLLTPQPFVWKKAIVAILILMFMIGLPIALITKHYYSRPNTN